MAKLISKYRDHHEYIWKCDCYGGHYLEMTWDDEDEEWRYLSISDSCKWDGIWDRVKGAFNILRGHPYHHGAEIILDDANVKDLLEVLTKHSDFEFPRHRSLKEEEDD